MTKSSSALSEGINLNAFAVALFRLTAIKGLRLFIGRVFYQDGAREKSPRNIHLIVLLIKSQREKLFIRFVRDLPKSVQECPSALSS